MLGWWRDRWRKRIPQLNGQIRYFAFENNEQGYAQALEAYYHLLRQLSPKKPHQAVYEHCLPILRQMMEWYVRFGVPEGEEPNRIIHFEREGIINDDLLIKIAGALEIDWAKIEELAGQDRREHIDAWNKWADEPATMRLVIRLMAAIYSNCPLPNEITTPEAAEAYACDQARQLRLRMCLVLSRRQSVWINEDGTVRKRTDPPRSIRPNRLQRAD